MFQLLDRAPNNALPERSVLSYAAELVQAVHNLHGLGYVHRDIKPDNLLIGGDGHLVITDFGSCAAAGACRRGSAAAGTIDYTPPEVLAAAGSPRAARRGSGGNKPDDGSVCAAADWWSVGVVLYEMLFGQMPFSNDGSTVSTYEAILGHAGSLELPPAGLEAVASADAAVIARGWVSGSSRPPPPSPPLLASGGGLNWCALVALDLNRNSAGAVSVRLQSTG